MSKFSKFRFIYYTTQHINVRDYNHLYLLSHFSALENHPSLRSKWTIDKLD